MTGTGTGIGPGTGPDPETFSGCRDKCLILCPITLNTTCPQASLKIIAFILLFTIGTFSIGGFLFILTDPWFPFNFPYQKICQGSDFDPNSREKFLKLMLINLSSKSLLLILCTCNHYRVYRFEKNYGKSYFIHRRQNILTFRQTVISSYVYIIIYIGATFLQQYTNLFESQATYRWVNTVYQQISTLVLTTALPLIWFISVGNNFPEFWSTNNLYTFTFRTSIAPENKITDECLKRDLIPRGPYVYQHETDKVLEAKFIPSVPETTFSKSFSTYSMKNKKQANSLGAISKGIQIKLQDKKKTLT